MPRLTPHSPGFQRNRRLLHGGIAAAIVVVVVTALTALAYLRQQAESRAEATTQNLAVAVEQSFEGMLNTIDVALLASADEIAARLHAEKSGRPGISSYLIRQGSRLPDGTTLRATNERGDVIFGVGVPNPPNNAADRDFFILARDNPHAGMIVSKPILARVDRQWIWVFSRRINKPDGSFGGIVFARTTLGSIEKKLAQIRLGTDSIIALRDHELGMIARHPPASLLNIPVGSKKVATPFTEALKEHPDAGTYISGETSIDGISRTHSYRRNAKYGFMVNVGISVEHGLAEWHKQVWITLSLMSSLIIASLFFSRLISLAWQRQDEDMAALAASREALQEAQKIAHLGHYRYDIVADGWTSSEVLDDIFGINDDYPHDSRHWLELIVPDSRQEMDTYLTMLIREHRVFDREYQIIRPSNGEMRWVHGRGRLELDEGGKPLALFGTIEDITDRKFGQQRLENLLLEQKAILENSLVGIIKLRDRKILWVNQAIEKMFGYGTGELIGQCTRTLYPSDDAFNKLGAAAYPQLAAGKTYSARIELLQKSGKSIWVDLRGAILNWEKGESLWGFLDISESKLVEQRLLESKTRFRQIFDSVNDAIFIHDADTGVIIDVNQRMCEMYECRREQVISHTAEHLSQGTAPYSAADAAEHIRRTLSEGPQTFEWLAQTLNGRTFWAEVSLRQARIGPHQQILAVVRDISQRKSTEDAIKQLAFYDPLTKLPNRRLMTDRMQQLLSRNSRTGEMVAICMLDLDGFKAVNDRLGHDAGDILLCEIARRLLENTRQADTVARLGGDEFALLLGQFSDFSDCEQLLSRVVSSLARPMSIKGDTAQVSASIGVAIFPNDSLDPDMLMRCADKAMYEVKQSGKNRFQFYHAEDNNRHQVHQETLGKISKALSKGQFELFYQPQIDCRQGKLVGVEALVRWRHPILGILPPSEFLPLIEHNDHIVSLDGWVIKEALRQMMVWREAGLDLQISINASPRQLRSKDFAERLSEALAAYPSDCAERLNIEIGESAALENIHSIDDAIRASHNEGVSIALDDFGTGFSSLTHLTQLSADILKIDRGIIGALFEGPQNVAMVESIIGLGYAFQRKVVAEGVESIDQAMLLLEMGCPVMQGFFFARPMPASEFLDWARAFTPHPHWYASADSGQNHDYHDLIQALVCHHHWLSRVLANTASRNAGELGEALLTADQCQFGQWYSGSGQRRFSEHPAFAPLGQVHREIHQITAHLYATRHTGEQAAIRADEAQLLARHKELLRLLSSLRAMLDEPLINPYFDQEEKEK